MWQCKSPQHSTLSADDQHLLSHSHSADNILRLLGVVKLINVINLVDVRLVIHKPTDLSTHLAISNLRGRLEHGQSGGLTLVLPHVDVVFGACNDVGLGHSEHRNIQSCLFCLDGGSNGITEIDLSDLLFRMRENRAELALALDLNQLLHVLHVLLIGFGVPEDHAELHSVGFLVAEDQNSIGEVTPLVVGPDCSHVDVGSCCNCNPEAGALPSDVIDCLCIGDPEVF